MSNTSNAATRDRSIILAVLTSIASKFGTLLLRLVSIPIAIKALGIAEFGVYTAITIVVAMVDTFHVGIGPALTQRLSKAVTNNDIKNQKILVATSMLTSFVLTALFMAIFALIFWKVPVPVLFGEKFAPFADTMQTAAWLALVIIAIEFACILAECARDGYLETRISNLWGAAGNITGAVVLFVGINHFNSIFFLIIAVNGSIAAAKLGNLIHFFAKRPFLLNWLKNYDRTLVKPLLLSGGIFSITYSLSALIEYSALGYLAGRYLGPDAAATCGIFVTIHVSLTGALQMFTIPAWPALIDARGRNDFTWIRKTATRLRFLTLTFGLAVIGGMALLGPWAIDLWIGEELVVGRLGMVAFAAFFAIHLWRHANQILLLGFDQEKWVAAAIVVESATVLAAVWLALHATGDLVFVYFAVAASIALVSGWLFPARFAKMMRRDKTEVHETSTQKLGIEAESGC